MGRNVPLQLRLLRFGSLLLLLVLAVLVDTCLLTTFLEHSPRSALLQGKQKRKEKEREIAVTF